MGMTTRGLRASTTAAGLPGVDGVVAAHGDHQGVQPAQPLCLLRRQRAAQVSQVGDPQPISGNNMDGIGAAQGAALRVVEGVQLLHLEGDGTPGQLYRLPGAVVPVLMAAQHQVRGQVQRG